MKPKSRKNSLVFKAHQIPHVYLYNMIQSLVLANAALASTSPSVFLEKRAGSDDFCWKPNYGRGVGQVPNACPGKQIVAGLCYTPCQAGFYSDGPVFFLF